MCSIIGLSYSSIRTTTPTEHLSCSAETRRLNIIAGSSASRGTSYSSAMSESLMPSVLERFSTVLSRRPPMSMWMIGCTPQP